MRALGRIGILVLALALVALPAAAAAAKKGSSTKAFKASIAPNAAIPEATAGVRSTPVRSTITVPKSYKGKVVGDVNVTGLQTTGSVLGAADDLTGYLISPGGRTLELFYTVGAQNLGPWTMDDDTPTSICNSGGPGVCANSTQTLLQPFAGRANTNFNWAGGFPVNGTLAIFNNVKMAGTWTLLVTDTIPAGAGNGTSVLNGWGLKITPAKPVAG